jgi:hypothetical protein
MRSVLDLQRDHDELVRQATRLAGGLHDLSQRATVYHHLFEHSGRNHVFPLIAAHGALWARGYFRFGMRLGCLLAWQYLAAAKRRRQLIALENFADAFRDVNRRVCIDTYVSYHFADRFGDHPAATHFVAPSFLAALNEVHAARRRGQELPDEQKRLVFQTHFLHEQEHVVGPSLAAAAEALDWPLLKFIALKPVIRFAYFPQRQRLWFRNFTNQAERIEKGFRAFDMAIEVGLPHVEAALRAYDVLPAEFFGGSANYFAELRSTLLAGT